MDDTKAVTDSQTKLVQLRQVLHTVPPTPAHPCAYLPGQVARDRGFAVQWLAAETWQHLLDSGWRRAGAMIYEPACPFCRSCVSIRIPVARFEPNRAQRRAWQRNQDLTIQITPVQITDERAELYRRYITTRHNGMMTGSLREFQQFLGTTPVDTIEIEYRLEGRLLAVGTVDRLSRGWSCVYCYFDPDESSRSLGTFNVMQTIELCRDQCPAGENAYVYLGYWVAGSKTMDYKKTYRHHEVLGIDKRWYNPEEVGADLPSPPSQPPIIFTPSESDEPVELSPDQTPPDPAQLGLPHP